MTDEIVGIIGDLDWKGLRKFMVIELLKVNNEKELLFFLNGMVMSLGDKKKLAKIRKKFNLKPFSKEDKELMKRLDIK